MTLKRMSGKHERVGVGHEPTDAFVRMDGCCLGTKDSCTTAALC